MTPPSPIIVGGVGGSGTRVVARVLSGLGVDMGGDCNQAFDDLWSNLLFFRPRALLAGKLDDLDALQPGMRMMERSRMREGLLRSGAEAAYLARAALDLYRTDNFGSRPTRWLLERLRVRLRGGRRRHAAGVWGWKEPTTHLFVHHFLKGWPHARYVHVTRHGLDMAFSNNLNQLARFGRFHGVRDVTPPDALRFWVEANALALSRMAEFPGRTLVIRFEDLCEAPLATIERLAEGVGITASPDRLAELAGLVEPPAQLHRYPGQSLEAFDPADLARLESLGYTVDGG